MTVSNSQLNVAGSNIKLKKEVKCLDIINDNQLTFKTKGKSVLQKMALGIKPIQTINNNVPKNVQKCCFMLLSYFILNIVTFF